MTNVEMDKMTDHELMSEAEKQLNHAKWALIVAGLCFGIVVFISVL